ncbi:hypothetical protein BJX63DRAFT_360921 [Aspergillus granulosus]|uniref:Transglutaminase-like domain-containing protein n=1 Tax=Aspergillus granulosus TaxID=176169 RepID=A0ABR4HW75_9EURO
MSEETQVLSIQDRIRALKQAQNGQGSEGTGSPFLGTQPTAFALRPSPPQPDGVSHHTPPLSHSDRPSPVGRNTLAAAVAQRPPPRSGETAPVARQQPKVPPPLPARKSSSQLAPSLPPRRPSTDSAASDASRSTTTSTGRPTTGSSAKAPGSIVKAPPWGATTLPPLPPKREDTKPVVPSSRPTPSRPKTPTAKSSDLLPPPRPGLPPRRSSGQSVSTISTVSTESSFTQARPPPQLPSRNTRDRSPAPVEGTKEKPPAKKLPPPVPSGADLNKIQGFGFGGLNKKATEVEVKEVGPEFTSADAADASPVPPPVPRASRPELSAIQATKPRVSAADASAAVVPTVCLKCRDFSAPDAHAARYPRESLPTHDLGWLASELTAPFPSLTDKARAIFTWLHHNIDYDTVSFYNNCVKPSTPGGTFATGLAVCQGYAELFEELATRAGLEAKVVSGHGKGYGYSAPVPGAPLPSYSPGHAWNAVRIDNNQWKLIDACWGAGHVNGPGQPYSRSFNPAMFTNTNDEFGLRHYPGNRAYFYRDDGRPEISWEEYLLGNPNSPLGAAQPRVFGDAKKHSIGERSYRPASEQISIHQPGPLRFQFNLICEHWTLERHTRAKPGLFLLMIHGVDGRQADRLPLTHWRGSGPAGGGDVWYVDVPDPRMLGAPGQKAQLAVLTKFGNQEDARGVTVEEYQRQVGRVGMAWAYIAEWELVA